METFVYRGNNANHGFTHGQTSRTPQDPARIIEVCFLELAHTVEMYFFCIAKKQDPAYSAVPVFSTFLEPKFFQCT